MDDLLCGADTVEEALDLYAELKSVLANGGFNLRKWRSSSSAVLSRIPVDTLEPLPTKELVDNHVATYPRPLGLT